MSKKKRKSLIRIRGKRNSSDNKPYIRVGLFIPVGLIKVLQRKYKADSLQSLFFAMALDKAEITKIDNVDELYIEPYYDQFG